MKKVMKQTTIKVRLVIGLGYWKDVYKEDKVGVEARTHNFVLPFILIQHFKASIRIESS